MSKTYKHKILGKFNNDEIHLKDIPNNIRKYWDRCNFDIGELRKRKQDKLKKAVDKE